MPRIDQSATSAEPDDRTVVNIAAYKFVTLDRLSERRRELRLRAQNGGLKGTILLAPEGINLFLAGSRAGVDDLLACLKSDPLLRDLEVKESLSAQPPFERLLVKVKPEIIAFAREGIDPRAVTSRKISPATLRDWLSCGTDVTLLDVRNNYEVRVGTFAGAVPVNVDHFREFPEAVAELPEELRRKPVVMFCTGGIRCEKAGPYLEQAGFQEVYQLSGGILKYFEDVGGEHYQGECFVFDKRVALDASLRETATTQCYACLSPLTVEDQASPHYDPPHACPHCHATPEEKQSRLLAQRHAALRRISSPLPGSQPYDNVRPLNVPARFAGQSLLEFVCAQHAHMGENYWQREITAGRIHQCGRAVAGERIVKPGEQFAHLQPATVEPDVSAAIEILHEDDALVVVHKPAPLPTHPGGRFHRNTLQWLLNAVYRPLKLKPAHRLDANTTGIVIFAKTREYSARLREEFDGGRVSKTYLARVWGEFPADLDRCELPISRESGPCGGRDVAADGLPSCTRFEILSRGDDGTTLLRVNPETGRTNQIRIHLWRLGFPVLGDPLYLPEQQLGGEQTHATGQRMALHAWRIQVRHPISGELVEFTTGIPEFAAGRI